MQVFNAVVHLAGEMKNQVQKYGLTVTEIYVLRRIHGNDAVPRPELIAEVDLDDSDERERLGELYDEGLGALEDGAKTTVKKMFGEYGPLPNELEGFEGQEASYDEDKELPDYQKAPLYVQPDTTERGRRARGEVRRRKEKAAAIKVPPVKKGTVAQKTLDSVM